MFIFIFTKGTYNYASVTLYRHKDFAFQNQHKIVIILIDSLDSDYAMNKNTVRIHIG